MVNGVFGLACVTYESCGRLNFNYIFDILVTLSVIKLLNDFVATTIVMRTKFLKKWPFLFSRFILSTNLKVLVIGSITRVPERKKE